MRAVLQDGNPAAKSAECLGELQANVTPANDDEMLGQASHFEDFDMSERFGFTQAGDGRDGGVGAEVEKDVFAGDGACAAVVELDLEGLGSGESSLAHDELGAGV